MFTLSERNVLYTVMSNLNRSCHRLETFLLTVHSRPFVNEHYLYVQGIYLYHSYVVVENLFKKKETASRFCH